MFSDILTETGGISFDVEFSTTFVKGEIVTPIIIPPFPLGLILDEPRKLINR
jgi:hypothetical protein